MSSSNKVSESVIKRLPMYFRYLCDLEMKGFLRISSKELGMRMGLTASQIRQDINCFGGFGQQGYGYNVPELCAKMGEILGLTRHYKMIIIGAGNIGQAIANYSHFKAMGFDVCAMFDISPKLINKKIHNVEILPISSLEQFIANSTIDIGVICTPDHNAQQSCDILINGGVKGIWNFAPVDISTPTSVPITNVHLSDSLLVLSYRMQEQYK